MKKILKIHVTTNDENKTDDGKSRLKVTRRSTTQIYDTKLASTRYQTAKQSKRMRIIVTFVVRTESYPPEVYDGKSSATILPYAQSLDRYMARCTDLDTRAAGTADNSPARKR
jgi:hypothetical protein